MLVPVSTKSRSVKLLTADFESAWTDKGSVPLSAKLVSRYESARTDVSKPRISPSAIRRILGASPSQAPAQRPTRRYWRDAIIGFAAKATELVLKDETNWTKLGYHWFSTEPRYRRGDQVLLLSTLTKRNTARLVEIVDTTRTATATPDGRHFVAYRHLPRGKVRVIGKRFWDQLKQAGIRPSTRTRFGTHAIAPTKWLALRSALGV